MWHTIPYSNMIVRSFRMSYLFSKTVYCLATHLCQEARRYEVIKRRGYIDTVGHKRGAAKFGQLTHDILVLRLFSLLQLNILNGNATEFICLCLKAQLIAIGRKRQMYFYLTLCRGTGKHAFKLLVVVAI